MFSSRKTGSASNAYNLTNSLRFRSSASAYLSRTPTVTSNQKTWTWSGWVKRGSLGSFYGLFCGWDNSTGATDVGTAIRFATDSLDIFSYTNNAYDFQLTSTALYRDPSSWYHVVVAVDTSQATSSNRVKVYVNGTQVTSFSTSTYPSLNFNTTINLSGRTNSVGSIGIDNSVGQSFDGYLAEINFIDGQALTPSSFGATSSTTGVWQPIKYTGTYGTNGFYLPFTNTTSTSTLGNDFSGNGNTWTVNNISLTAGSTYDSMTDVPTLTSATVANYCVLNPIIPIPRGTISQGNLNYLSGSAASHGSVASSFTLPTTGKWYWEVTACNNSGSSGNNEVIGVANILNNPQLPAAGSEIGSGSRGDYAYRSDGNKYNNGNQGAYGATYTNGDVIGVAWDSDNGTIAFYKNGTSQGTAFSSITQVAGKFAPASSNAETSNGDSYNFGQRPFAYTPPTGFNRLNTFNLPTPTIGTTSTTQANKYMDATLYTGNGSTQSITNSGSMQPDLVWIKVRSNALSHCITDAVRGTNLQLASNSTGGDQSTTDGITAFNSNGFSLGAGTQQYSSNTNTYTYVAWQWKANGAGSTNTAGSITSTVSANTSAGFSIVTFTFPSSNLANTIGHGLGVAPAMYIVKERSTTSSWFIYHQSLGATKSISLNGTGAADTNQQYWNNTAPTSSVISVGQAGTVYWDLNSTAVAYCFAQIAGYSAFGSYTGNGSSDGPFIYTGFRPRWVMVKKSSAAGNWLIFDTARSTFNVQDDALFPNLANAETASTNYNNDFVSNGFKIRTLDGSWNDSGVTYIYMAFAESPFKYANAR